MQVRCRFSPGLSLQAAPIYQNNHK